MKRVAHARCRSPRRYRPLAEADRGPGHARQRRRPLLRQRAGLRIRTPRDERPAARGARFGHALRRTRPEDRLHARTCEYRETRRARGGRAREPADVVLGHTLQSPWDPLDRAYFNGYALWTYLTTPSCHHAGLHGHEIEPWREGDEIWRVCVPPSRPRSPATAPSRTSTSAPTTFCAGTTTTSTWPVGSPPRSTSTTSWKRTDPAADQTPGLPPRRRRPPAGASGHGLDRPERHPLPLTGAPSDADAPRGPPPSVLPRGPRPPMIMERSRVHPSSPGLACQTPAARPRLAAAVSHRPGHRLRIRQLLHRPPAGPPTHRLPVAVAGPRLASQVQAAWGRDRRTAHAPPIRHATPCVIATWWPRSARSVTART